MTLVNRFLLTLALVCLCIGLGLGYAYYASKKTIQDLAADHTQEHAEFLTSAIDLQGVGLESLVSSYSRWSDMVKFMANPSPEWASHNVDNIVGIPNGGDALWIFTPSLDLVHSIDADSRRPPIPFAHAGELRAHIGDQYTFSYFVERQGRIWQIFGSAIQSPDFWRHETPVEGYLLLGKVWDADWLARLGALAHSRLAIELAGDPRPVGRDSPYQFTHPIAALGGGALATLRGTFDATSFEQFRLGLRWQLVVIALALFVAVAGLGAYIVIVVFQPLNRITRSLESRNPRHLLDLLGARNDFGVIARLLSSQFRQGRMLRDEITRHFAKRPSPDPAADDESPAALRGRLASDLHDGPLQSLYAAGLKLSGLEARLNSGHPPTATQLESVRHILTECGANLRNILLDLEPEELQEQDLETALMRLERNLRLISRRDARMHVAEGVLDDIARPARSHLYYIARELVSNAARHSRPSHVLLDFARRGNFLLIRWENDGFTPVDPPRPGNGLRNIGHRVEQLGGHWSYRILRGPIWQVEIELPFTALGEDETGHLELPDPAANAIPAKLSAPDQEA
jgi:signal transduction histidine kinase